MKKKLLCTLSLGLALSMTLLTGCAKPYESLGKALSNNDTMTSYQCNTNISVKVDGNTQLTSMNLTDFGLEMKSKVVGANDKNQSVASDISFKYGGMSIDSSIFGVTTIENNKPNSKFIISIPPIFAGMLTGMGLNGTSGSSNSPKYLVMDSKELEAQSKNTLTDAQTEKLNKAVDSLRKSLYNYVNTTGKDAVVKEGNKDITCNGATVNATVYQIKITDKELKSFIKGYVNTLTTDKDLQSFVDAMSSQPGSTTNYKDMVDNFNKNFDTLPQIIGDSGLNVTFAVKDNYVIQETFETDILLSNFNKDVAAGTSLGKVHFKISNDLFNINSKDIKVELPSVDSTNSIDIANLMNQQQPQQ